MNLLTTEQIEKVEELYRSLDIHYERDYNEETLVSTVVGACSAFAGSRFKATAKVHKDDEKFATSTTGINIAEMKVNILILSELFAHTKEDSEDYEIVKLAKEEAETVLKEYIKSKDAFYRKVEENRAKGGRTPTTFENLGDLLKDVPQAKREEIFTQIYSGVKEEQARINEEVEKQNPKKKGDK